MPPLSRRPCWGANGTPSTTRVESSMSTFLRWHYPDQVKGSKKRSFLVSAIAPLVAPRFIAPILYHVHPAESPVFLLGDRLIGLRILMTCRRSKNDSDRWLSDRFRTENLRLIASRTLLDRLGLVRGVLVTVYMRYTCSRPSFDRRALHPMRPYRSSSMPKRGHAVAMLASLIDDVTM